MLKDTKPRVLRDSGHFLHYFFHKKYFKEHRGSKSSKIQNKLGKNPSLRILMSNSEHLASPCILNVNKEQFKKNKIRNIKAQIGVILRDREPQPKFTGFNGTPITSAYSVFYKKT